MKKIFLTGILSFVFAAASLAQSDSAKVVKYVDEMSDDFFIQSSKALIVINEENTAGFSIRAMFDEKNGQIVQSGLMCKLSSMGTCVENAELIIQFTDSSKVTLRSWNDFNCDGNAYFNISDSEYKLLSSKQILKLRMTNGYSFKSLTRQAGDNQNDYFIYLYDQAKKNLITTIKE